MGVRIDGRAASMWREQKHIKKTDGENILPKHPLPRPTRKANNIKTSYRLAYEDGKDSVTKRWHLNYRRRGTTQKKT
jgi:hypothetical protein